VLHGRQLRSLRILGGIAEVPRLVADHGLKGIIVAINVPNQGLLDQLGELADQHQLQIYRWRVGLDEA